MLRVLMRIASPSREAMVPMNTTHSPGEPEQWTVVAITRGVGAGEEARPLPPQARPGAQTEPCSPPAKPRWFSWEMLAEMVH